AIPSKTMWNARLSVSLASQCAFTALDEPMPGSTHSRNARTPIFLMTVYQAHVGSKPSTLCCLQFFACFAANMCRMIFTRGFRQKEKSIVTESGWPLFFLHSSIVAPVLYV